MDWIRPTRFLKLTDDCCHTTDWGRCFFIFECVDSYLLVRHQEDLMQVFCFNAAQHLYCQIYMWEWGMLKTYGLRAKSNFPIFAP